MSLFAQPTFPVNGVGDERETTYAFKNATIVKNAQQQISNATMLVRNGKIIAVGTMVTIPADAIVVDCTGKFIYPSFIDLYTDYGIAPVSMGQGQRNFLAPAQLTSNAKGAFGWEPSHQIRC
jgi:imidazolonepropionase-like amidohydrolase